MPAASSAVKAVSSRSQSVTAGQVASSCSLMAHSRATSVPSHCASAGVTFRRQKAVLAHALLDPVGRAEAAADEKLDAFGGVGAVDGHGGGARYADSGW